MKKLTYENKIDIYNKRKAGLSRSQIANIYNVNITTIKYLVRLIDKHGFKILKIKHKKYSIDFKMKAINRVLINQESIISVSIDMGLPDKGTLSFWLKKYKENGYNIVERKRGRPTMPKVTKIKENETDKEKIKRLEEQVQYLSAELEYTKKLRAVVQARKNQQQKKK